MHEEYPPKSPGNLLPWITAIAMFIQSLDATILNTSLPVIARDMHYSPTEMHSVIISYTLTLALFIPLSGWLSDRYGTKNVFIVAVAIFVTGSLGCAISFNLLTLNVSRIIQAIGGSMMVPVARLAILYQYPRNQLLKTMNFITVFGLLGLVVGPSLGGFLSDYLSWHWIFLVNVPIGIAGIFLAYKIMPNFTNTVGKFDFVGLLYFSAALILLTISLELIGNRGNRQWLLIGLTTGLSIIGMILYYKHFRKSDRPLIDLRLLRIRTLRVGLLGSLTTRLGIGGLPLMLPLMLQSGFGYSATVSGLLLLPSALANIATKPMMVKIISSFGYRTVLISNTVLIGVVLIVLSFVTRETALFFYIILMVFYGIFISIQMSAMNTIALSDLDERNASGGNTMLVIMQQLSVSFGVSIASLVLSFYQSDAWGLTLAEAFQYTFFSLAILTVVSSITFTGLKPGDGNTYT